VSHTLVLNRRIIGFKHQCYGGTNDTKSMDSRQNESGDTSDGSINIYLQRIAMLENALQKSREEAFQSGFREGQRSMDEQLKRQVEELPREFAQMARELKDQFVNTIEKMEKPVMHFGIQIAQRILGQVLKEDAFQKQMLESQVRKFLSAIVDESKVIIHVNPKQMEWINQLDMAKSTSVPAKMLFRSNDKLAPGECLLETENFIVDGTIAGQLERIEKKIMGNN